MTNHRLSAPPGAERVSPRSRPSRRGLLRLAAPVALLPLLAACGATPSGPGPAPTPPPTQPQAQATDKPGITVANLAKRVAEGWRGVKSYRMTVRGTMLTQGAGATPATGASPVVVPVGTPGVATPVAAGAVPTEVVWTYDVILPDRQHVTLRGAGENDVEAIVIGKTMVARGGMIESLGLSPATDEWAVVDPAKLDPNDARANTLLHLYDPIGLPITFQEKLFEQVVRPLGAMPVNGVACEGYGLADTNLAGTRLDITVALDDKNRPCTQVTSVNNVPQRQTVWDQFDAIAPIDFPAGVALPATPSAATPVAATPVGG